MYHISFSANLFGLLWIEFFVALPYRMWNTYEAKRFSTVHSAQSARWRTVVYRWTAISLCTRLISVQYHVDWSILIGKNIWCYTTFTLSIVYVQSFFYLYRYKWYMCIVYTFPMTLFRLLCHHFPDIHIQHLTSYTYASDAEVVACSQQTYGDSICGPCYLITSLNVYWFSSSFLFRSFILIIIFIYCLHCLFYSNHSYEYIYKMRIGSMFMYNCSINRLNQWTQP